MDTLSPPAATTPCVKRCSETFFTNQKITASLDRALNDDAFRASLDKIGFPPLQPKSLVEIDKFIETDRARWAGVIKALNISLD